MKCFTSNEELKALINNGVIEFSESVVCEFSIDVDADIKSAMDIKARGIKAWNISAWNISAGNITARDISAWNISARNISARDISARDISARDISFYALCFAYVSLKCKSISGRRENAKFGCLDSEVEYVGPAPRATTKKGY